LLNVLNKHHHDYANYAVWAEKPTTTKTHTFKSGPVMKGFGAGLTSFLVSYTSWHQ